MIASSPQLLLTGQTLSFKADPFVTKVELASAFDSAGGVLIEAGRILAQGPAADLRRHYPQAQVIDYGDKLIMAGFIDAHVHYPQTAIIASWGNRLIDWLNQYTFPKKCDLAMRLMHNTAQRRIWIWR